MTTPLTILTNVGSLEARTNLTRTARSLRSTIGQISSGLRVRSAADDAAGIAVSENLRAQNGGYEQALRNASEGIAILQTAESGFQSLSDALVRMRELAVQASSDGLTDTERAYLDTEFGQLVDYMERVAASTEYNGQTLLDGTAGDGAGVMVFQVGTRNTANDRVTITLADQDTTALGVSATQVDTLANAQGAIDDVDAALELLATDRAAIGATIGELTAEVDYLGTTVLNLAAALSQIRDVDMASASAAFARDQVLQEAGVAMLAQANTSPLLALRLLE